uniref:CBS domain-containing protein n=1 Tax=Ascaris lumbricoides TaxID=6252 RepID=A0A0M3HR26_ASCLU
MLHLWHSGTTARHYGRSDKPHLGRDETDPHMLMAVVSEFNTTITISSQDTMTALKSMEQIKTSSQVTPASPHHTQDVDDQKLQTRPVALVGVIDVLSGLVTPRERSLFNRDCRKDSRHT